MDTQSSQFLQQELHTIYYLTKYIVGILFWDIMIAQKTITAMVTLLTNNINQKAKYMNYSTAIFIVKEDQVRAIACQYEKVEENRSAKVVTFKSLDKSIKVGDIVVVPSHTRHNFTTNKVVAVDVEVDLESTQKMDWIVARMDDDDYKVILAQEEEIIKKVKSAELRKKKADLFQNLKADQEAIEALPLLTPIG